MKRLWIPAGVVLILILGCQTCPTCWGQDPPPMPTPVPAPPNIQSMTESPANNDLVIDVTEALEWREAILDIANQDLGQLVDMIFLIGAGAKVPTGTQTVTINNAQLNRWFNTTDMGSGLSRFYWEIAKNGVRLRRPVRKMVENMAITVAPTRIPNETKRNKFLSQLDNLQVNQAVTE